MNAVSLGFEFERPALLLLLALLPLWAWLRGQTGRAGALLFPNSSLLDGIGKPVREAVGRLRPFIRLLTAACFIVAIAGPRTANKEVDRDSEGIDVFLVIDLLCMSIHPFKICFLIARWNCHEVIIISNDDLQIMAISYELHF